MNNEDKTTECVYCKEKIHSEATKCKHCGSELSESKPLHKGICPYCKEKIHNDAVKCKHCKTLIVTSAKHTWRELRPAFNERCWYEIDTDGRPYKICVSRPLENARF